MSYREIPVNTAYGMVDTTAKLLGLEPKVEASSHSLDIEYTLPDKDTRAWDSDLYKSGNLFVSGYANPIKPVVHHNQQLENPDTIDVREAEAESNGQGNTDGESDGDDSDGDEGPHVSLISSARYRDYMRQDLVSQLLTPQEQWKLIAYGVLGLALLQFLAIIITMYATGSF